MNHVEKIHEFYKKNLKKIPHIGLTGLNPHCESYSNTNEEDKIIKPAINFLLKKKTTKYLDLFLQIQFF